MVRAIVCVYRTTNSVTNMTENIQGTTLQHNRKEDKTNTCMSYKISTKQLVEVDSSRLQLNRTTHKAEATIKDSKYQLPNFGHNNNVVLSVRSSPLESSSSGAVSEACIGDHVFFFKILVSHLRVR